MNVREKIGLFDRDAPRLHIFREGRFAKLYNESAYLFGRHFRAYKVMAKESRTGHYYTVGFPSMMLEEVIGEVAGCELTEVDIGHHVCANDAFVFDEAEYAAWCEAAERTFVPRPAAPAQYPAGGWGYPAAAGAPMPVPPPPVPSMMPGAMQMPPPPGAAVPVQGVQAMPPVTPVTPVTVQGVPPFPPVTPVTPAPASPVVLQPASAPPPAGECPAGAMTRTEGAMAVAELAGEILRFRLESATPVECMLFLETLRRRLLNGAIPEPARL